MTPSELFKRSFRACAKTGSREICTPAPVDTDDDTIILLAPGEMVSEQTTEALENNEWEFGGSLVPGSYFISWKKGEENWIITDHPLFYEAFTLATGIAKSLNIKDKADRIALFDIVRRSMGLQK